MTDPNTPTTPTNPQDLIDQALGNNVASNPVTTTGNEPASVTPAPALPTPEPLNTPPVTEPVVEQKSEEVVTPNNETVPVELTNSQNEPATMPELPNETKPMAEDMPLAFAGAADSTASASPEPSVAAVTEPFVATVPPVLTTPQADQTSTPKKKKGLKIVGLVVGFFVMFGVVGAVSYQMITGQSLIAAVTTSEFIPKWSKVDGVLVKNPDYVALTGTAKENNDDKRDKYLGVGEYAPDPKIESANYKGACDAAGGQWCDYGFCMKNDGSQGNCNNRAVELGYTVNIGKVQCECKDSKIGSSGCQNWGVSAETLSAIDAANVSTPTRNANLKDATDQCQNGGNFTGAGTESYICKEGVKGGTEVYTGGPCTADNGKKFTGNLGCFCGTVQVDTPNGHTSYSSTCGCGEKEAPSVASTPTPSSTPAPTLMCDGLTRTPTTTPAIGDNLTFTCAGSSVPTGSVSLTYKFRYSLNSGSYISMTNATPTTANMTIAACGTYKVQCQACGTINGVLTCDPNWVSATTQ